MRLALVLTLCLIASPVFAQQDVVATVKAQLQARGVDLSGPCGAFQITRRVAYQLQYFLLKKPAGNNCDGYAVDIVIRNDGQGFDVLGDGGTDNRPVFEPSDVFSFDRWALATNPDVGEPPPVVTPGPTVPLPPVGESPRLAIIEQAVADIRQQNLVNQTATLARLEALSLQLRQHDESPSWASSVFGNRYVQLVLAAVGTYVTTQQMQR